MDATTDLSDQRPLSKSRGRRKIEIKKVEKENRRYVTFSKRKSGMFKKATELSTLCGADVAVILISEHGKVFSCGNPNMDKVLDRYLAQTEGGEYNSCVLESSGNADIVTQTLQKQEYEKSLRRLEEMKSALKMVGKKSNNVKKGEFWWDLPMDNMEKEELEGYKESLEELKKNVMARIEVMAAHNAAGESSIINEFIDHNGVWSSSTASYDAGFNNGFL